MVWVYHRTSFSFLLRNYKELMCDTINYLNCRSAVIAGCVCRNQLLIQELQEEINELSEGIKESVKTLSSAKNNQIRTISNLFKGIAGITGPTGERGVHGPRGQDGKNESCQLFQASETMLKGQFVAINKNGMIESISGNRKKNNLHLLIGILQNDVEKDEEQYVRIATGLDSCFQNLLPGSLYYLHIDGSFNTQKDFNSLCVGKAIQKNVFLYSLTIFSKNHNI